MPRLREEENREKNEKADGLYPYALCHFCHASCFFRFPDRRHSKNTMIKILRATAILLFSLSVHLQADDISDAKSTFQTLVEYQKTDDPRSPALFADDCFVKFVHTDGTRTKEKTFNAEQFRDWLGKVLALKQGNTDIYENIEFQQEDQTVKAAGMVYFTGTGLRGPISLLYARDTTGNLRIKEMITTIPVPKK